ncbi:MAG: DUF4331 domain-containing protein [Spirillospora sp.]
MPSHTRRTTRIVAVVAAAVLLAAALVPPFGGASSHREAPLISQDPAADGTDFYMFRSPDRPDTVTFIANYYPIQDPAGGPNFYRFGDDVLYTIRVDDNGDNVDDQWFEFRFTTFTRSGSTFLYNTGPVTSLDDPDLNVYQQYTVTRVLSNGKRTVLGSGLPVPPNNIGPKSTPDYDALASAAIRDLPGGYKVFAGQRDDPFWVDLGAVFDLLTIRPGAPGNKGGGRDDLAGANVLTIALQAPITSLTNDGSMPAVTNAQFAVIAGRTTSYRQRTKVLHDDGKAPTGGGDWVQVSRLGHALVNEVVAPLGAKDFFNSLQPSGDGALLGAVTDPEVPKLLKAIYGIDVPPTPRNDLVAIFLTGIPGLTKPAFVKPSEQLRLNLAVPVTAAPNRMGVLGGDNGGYPNGRRLGDDVVDISLQAMAGGTPFTPDQNKAPNNQLGDGVNQNEKPYLAAFPYVASPHQGFEHTHHRTEPATAATAYGGSIQATLA